MSRNLVIAAFVSLLVHAGVAFSGYLMPEEAATAPLQPEVPTIALDLPPPPEPEEPEEIFDNSAAEAPAEIASLAPPMQADVPSAVIDSAFVQQIQPPPPPGLDRPTGASIIPTLPARPAVGSALKNVFNLADLDEPLQVRLRPPPVYPFEMRRAAITGEVLLEFIVDPQGNVRDPRVLRSSHPGFEQAAIDAALKWKFKSGKKGGAAVNTRVRQLIPFTLKSE